MAMTLWRVFRREGLAALLVALSSAAFFAFAVHAVVGAAGVSASLRHRLEITRGKYIVEDVVRRALTRLEELRAGARLVVAEGQLSSFPQREAWVELRTMGGHRALVCGLNRGEPSRGGRTLIYRSKATRGLLPPEFSWALGELEPAESKAGLVFEARDGEVRSPVARKLEAMPFRAEKSWSDVDFSIHRDCWDAREGQTHTLAMRNFRPADELALQNLATPTGLENFELGNLHGSRVVAAFRGERDLVVRVKGHLWLGRPDRKLIVGTGGRSLLILVDGNVRIRGSVEMLSENDRLFLVAGRPGYGAFRDRDGDGVRDPSEILLAPHVHAPVLGPVEGGGLIYVGDAASRPHIDAGLLASQDVIVAHAGAEIEGAVLCRSLLRLGTSPGALVIRGRRRTGASSIPPRGFPVVPGTEELERVQPPELWQVRNHRYEPLESSAPIAGRSSEAFD